MAQAPAAQTLPLERPQWVKEGRTWSGDTSPHIGWRSPTQTCGHCGQTYKPGHPWVCDACTSDFDALYGRLVAAQRQGGIDSETYQALREKVWAFLGWDRFGARRTAPAAKTKRAARR